MSKRLDSFLIVPKVSEKLSAKRFTLSMNNINYNVQISDIILAYEQDINALIKFSEEPFVCVLPYTDKIEVEGEILPNILEFLGKQSINHAKIGSKDLSKEISTKLLENLSSLIGNTNFLENSFIFQLSDTKLTLEKKAVKSKQEKMQVAQKIFEKIKGIGKIQEILESILFLADLYESSFRSDGIPVKMVMLSTGTSIDDIEDAYKILDKIINIPAVRDASIIDDDIFLDKDYTLKDIVDLYEDVFGYNPTITINFRNYNTNLTKEIILKALPKKKDHHPKSMRDALYKILKLTSNEISVKGFEPLTIENRSVGGRRSAHKVTANCRSQWVAIFMLASGRIDQNFIDATLVEYSQLDISWKKNNSCAFLVGQYTSRSEIEKILRQSQFPIVFIPIIKYFILMSMIIDDKRTKFSRYIARLLPIASLLGKQILQIDDILLEILKFRKENLGVN